MIKIDIRKAYDSIELSFLRLVMKAMGFPKKLMACMGSYVSTMFYSMLHNGKPLAPFKIARGLRQGDPKSFNLFVLVM